MDSFTKVMDVGLTPLMLHEGCRWKSKQQSLQLGLQPIMHAPVEEPRLGAVLLSQSEVQLSAPPHQAGFLREEWSNISMCSL